MWIARILPTQHNHATTANAARKLVGLPAIQNDVKLT